ncbi:MAG TPA: MDR family MFS transporter [Anaerolinea sp.]|nr:MDR family MFS transporter [Anaerolinea sp.]
MTKQRLNMITIGIMLSLFLASMEGTVVATAMPSIVAQLGGLSIYSWVFSMFMLTSTTTVPIYGKLSDLYGRKLVYMISMGLFLIGSVLCGQARTMEQLILFRAVQGLGAGGVLPLAFTIIGELFSLEQRAKMQGLFSGVWGVSAVIGPLIGGFLVDQVSWHWVFYINVLPGLVAAGLVWLAWSGVPAEHRTRVAVDYPGAILLTLGALALLLGMNELGSPLGWWALGAAAVMFAGLFFVERRAADPILPLHLFRGRLFNVTILHGMLAGWAVFGSLAYVPLFVQAVLGTSATQAGISLTPMSLSWTLASILGGRLLLKMGYRTLALIGMVLLVIGSFFMTRIGVHSSQASVMIFTGLMGVGMGLSIPAFLIAVQSAVRKSELGIATSTIQFSRSIGGTLGVSVLGVFLSSGLARNLLAAGIDPTTVSINALLDPLAGASAAVDGSLRVALAGSIASMFVVAFLPALAGLVVVLFTPGGKIAQIVQERALKSPSD